MSNTNTEVLTTAYEKLQGALTQSNTVLPKLEEAVEKGNLDNYATTSDLEEKANITGMDNNNLLYNKVSTEEGIYTSDDIQKLITVSIANGNKNMYLPNGTIRLTTPLLVLNGFNLYGNAKTVIEDYTNDYAIKYVGGDTFMTTPIIYTQLKNIEFQNKSNSSGAIYFENGYMLHMKNIKCIDGSYTNGEIVKLIDCFNITLEDSHISAHAGATGVVVDSIGGNGSQINIINSLIQRNATGILINGSSNLTDGVNIIGSGIGHNAKGIDIKGNVKAVNIEGSHIELNDYGLYFEENSSIDGVNVEANTFINNTVDVYSNGATRVKLDVNNFYSSTLTTGSISIKQSENDVRWKFGINQFHNKETNIDEKATDNICLEQIAIDKNGYVGLGRNQVRIYYGNYSPEGEVTAPVGSIYLRKNATVGTGIYTKISGDGNTGWLAFAYQAITFETSGLPSPSSLPAGASVFNTTTKKTITTDGTAWYDAMGNAL